MTGRGWKEGGINYNSIIHFNDLFEGWLALGGKITFFYFIFSCKEGPELRSSTHLSDIWHWRSR